LYRYIPNGNSIDGNGKRSNTDGMPSIPCGVLIQAKKKVNTIKSLIQLGTDVKFNDIGSRIFSRLTSNKKKSFIKEKKKIGDKIIKLLSKTIRDRS
jgi:hypothetical protein